MTLLAEAVREARQIPSLEGLSYRVEQETTLILMRERKEILFMGEIAQHKSLIDIAREITRRVIMPYLLIHGSNSYKDYKTFLDKLAKLEKIKDRGDAGFESLDSSVDSSLNFLDEGIRETYEMLYQGCCDIHFQRVKGVSPERKDVPEDYMPSSDRLRRFSSSRKGSYLLMCCDNRPMEEEIYD